MPPRAHAPCPSTCPPTGPQIRDPERETALSLLFGAHHPQLVRLALVLGADSDAEDVVADAFCELYRRWSGVRDRGAAYAYLRATVRNLVRLRIRRLRVERRRSARHAVWVESAEAAAVWRDEQRRVVAALRRLAPRQREAIVLRYWLDLHEADVARAMGISRGAVKSHTSRAMAALSEQLA